MGTKNISIMDDVYRILVRNRMGGESFSEVIRRNFSRKKDIMEFAGAWKDMREEEAEEMKEKIRELRKKSTKELLHKNGK